MLTADLVHVRRRDDVLTVVPLTPEERERAVALAGAYVELARLHVGETRGRLVEAMRAIPVSARERRLADGLTKLLRDRCVFEETSPLDPAAVRADVFARAAAHRRALPPRAVFERDTVLASVARERAVTPEALEQALYSDLPDAHVLRDVVVPGARALVALWEAAQVQAVLLRAVAVRVRIEEASPADCRVLFRKLKFQQLLHRIEPLPAPKGRGASSPGYLVHIDGPFSLFDSVTKYGLQLAVAYPAIAACGRWTLEADVRWGKDRRPLRFLARGQAPAGLASDEPALPDEVARLLADLKALESGGDSPWRAKVAGRVLDLPGVGLCIPDLELTHASTGRVVCIEVLGFWSRDAVWRRIELAQQGLPVPVIFVVSKHLRVSEAALPEEVPAALYVYAKVMSARALLARVADVAEKA